ncbi:MAG TPA: diaminopimelate dehydrogenase [Firmicutes bacterium]|nr:diaminopimelate dehydrogenase [Bacillota bacterium]
MIKVCVIGMGNVGHCAARTVLLEKDMELVGIIMRTPRALDAEGLSGVEVVQKIGDLSVKPDVAILCTPTRAVESVAKECLKQGISTVDCFDIHGDIVALRRTLDQAAKATGAVAVTASGWDPGSDSIVRTLMQAAAPKGITYTNFGPGMSMGHSVAAKSKPAVKDALSMTIPLGTGVHRRMVYIEVEDGCTYEEAAAQIKADDYFSHDETHVIAVDHIEDLKDVGHGVHMVRKGVSGETHNQIFSFDMKINNPALTAQMMVASARAATRQQPGCYTLIELPVIDFLCGEREPLIGKLV